MAGTSSAIRTSINVATSYAGDSYAMATPDHRASMDRARHHDAHRRQRRDARAGDQPATDGALGNAAARPRPDDPGGLRDRAAGPHRAAAHGVLPRRLEYLRLHRHRHLARAGDRGVHGAARAARAAPVAADHDRAVAAARGRRADRRAARHGIDRAPDRADLLRLRRDGGEPVRRGFPRTCSARCRPRSSPCSPS